MNRRTLTTLLMGTALIAPLSSGAQQYPSKAIRFVVPFAPGGGTDIIGRIMAQGLNDVLGQPVVVDNRGGAGSTLGTEIVAKSPADGYTILFGNISLAFNATLYTKLRYDTLRDLAPISLSAVQPNILVIHPSLPAKNLKEFIELVRASPGKYNYASAGTGAGTHLAAELLKLQTKIDIVHRALQRHRPRAERPARRPDQHDGFHFRLGTAPCPQRPHAGTGRHHGKTLARRTGRTDADRGRCRRLRLQHLVRSAGAREYAQSGHRKNSMPPTVRYLRATTSNRNSKARASTPSLTPPRNSVPT